MIDAGMKLSGRSCNARRVLCSAIRLLRNMRCGGRGFAREVAKRCREVRVEWFHQSHNKEARILSNAPAVLNRIAMPAGWQIRWHVLYGDLVTFRRLFRANRRDDAPDVLTGIIETESETASRKNIRAVGFSR